MVLSTFVQLAGLLAVGWYLFACAVFPFKPHRACGGRGFHRGLGGMRPCFRCKGTGQVLRRGRRLFDALMRMRDRNRKS